MGADGSITVKVPVSNTGSREGKETVQFYIGDEKSSLLRPLKELKGFDKLTIKPGDTAEATFTITPEALKFYDPASSSWVVEPGKFKLYIGSSSTDIRATLPFEYK